MIQIEIDDQAGAPVAFITGEIDGQSAPHAQDRLLAAFGDLNSVILDVSGVSFMSSAGLRMLLLLYRHAESRNGKVILVGLNEQISDTMSITGFLGFFTIHPTIDDAIATLRAP